MAVLVLLGRDDQQLGSAVVCARERPLLSHCIPMASLSHCCTESICRNPNASLCPHIKRQCLAGHCVGPEAARPLTVTLLVLAQLLVPDESKALVQPMNSRDAGPGNRGWKGIGCKGNYFSWLAWNPRSQSLGAGGERQIIVFKSFIVPL